MLFFISFLSSDNEGKHLNPYYNMRFVYFALICEAQCK